METGTKDAGIDIISVRRNSYPGNYGSGRNVSRSHGEYQRRTREPGRVRTGGSGGQRTLLSDSRRTRARRRQRLQIQCLAITFGIITLMVLGVSLLVKSGRASAADNVHSFTSGSAGGAGNANAPQSPVSVPREPAGTEPVFVQGIPAEEFAGHPEWEENFLTPNEYSRPGDELKEVKNIFVHYTANPGTSAAQNRSYFERQKDEHLASVSSHFIIGYDGEIIQCVPLTEIAYAVQTRNFDSVSIECCYKAKDGSFTKETYNSLISLLAWLTDVYELDTEDILRHYDCGGKKCPLYYTNHEDKWELLKEDVDNARKKGDLEL